MPPGKSFLATALTTMACVVGSSAILLQNPIVKAADIKDEGDFSVIYETPQNPEFAQLSQDLKKSNFYNELVAWLNESYALPQDIPIYFEECGEENAFYDPSEVKISMCYELIQKYVNIFAEGATSRDEYLAEVIDAGYFTLLHELGHALIDQYDLPVLGKEEDAVDNLAAILLIDWDEADSAISGMLQFAVDAEEEAEFEELAYWDEHSLGEQRFYNMACLIYGSDPATHEYLVTEEILPESRAERCELEYAQASNSWNTLLEPYQKE
ncbi:DUF4344 domain-containing metallopeptidase [Oscillatoria sp. FACHB-1406]|uniref:DUF4344 domain-containing metallopeptidase n=1 Tax=Oscillatoria sp. FACHB-1406 TaxID=2692846 RepID=UPI001688B40E|nr:DUF4344 domain-containing metallopeptidase [Oscillatoria sp. FACHB-1406]MBD2580005.1 DUF4344 domain-containing metallopeptidase [Oscillatoria sp. FACHB-1406]